jgi:hypothetical protein
MRKIVSLLNIFLHSMPVFYLRDLGSTMFEVEVRHFFFALGKLKKKLLLIMSSSLCKCNACTVRYVYFACMVLIIYIHQVKCSSGTSADGRGINTA